MAHNEYDASLFCRSLVRRAKMSLLQSRRWIINYVRAINKMENRYGGGTRVSLALTLMRILLEQLKPFWRIVLFPISDNYCFFLWQYECLVVLYNSQLKHFEKSPPVVFLDSWQLLFLYVYNSEKFQRLCSNEIKIFSICTCWFKHKDGKEILIRGLK